MSLPDYLLEPEDDACELCGKIHGWRCPVRYLEAQEQRAEELRERIEEERHGLL